MVTVSSRFPWFLSPRVYNTFWLLAFVMVGPGSCCGFPNGNTSYAKRVEQRKFTVLDEVVLVQRHLWIVGLQPHKALNLDDNDTARLHTIGRDNIGAAVGDMEEVWGFEIMPGWGGGTQDIYSPVLPGLDVLRLDMPPPPSPVPGWGSWYWAELHCGDCGRPMIAWPIPRLQAPSNARPRNPWHDIRTIWCPVCGWAMGTFGLSEPTTPPGYFEMYRYVDRATATAILYVINTRGITSRSRSRSRSPAAAVDPYLVPQLDHSSRRCFRQYLGTGSVLPESSAPRETENSYWMHGRASSSSHE